MRHAKGNSSKSIPTWFKKYLRWFLFFASVLISFAAAIRFGYGPLIDALWPIRITPVRYGETCKVEEMPGRCVRVFYATPRSAYLDTTKKTLQFRRSRDEGDVHWGFAEIIAPEPKGSLIPLKDNKPSDAPPLDPSDVYTKQVDAKVNVSRFESESEHSPGRREKAESGAFAAELNSALGQSDCAILLFVHGFKTNFDQAVGTAGQLAANLDFNSWDDRPLPIRHCGAKDVGPSAHTTATLRYGQPVVFTWPNGERFLNYEDDKASAEDAAVQLGPVDKAQPDFD